MRKNTFINRLKIALNFLVYGKGNVRIMTCGKCNSQAIKSITEEPFDSKYEKDGYKVDRYWVDFNKCLKCGAVCKEVQFWNFDGDPKMLDKDI